jgi:hypothetical protein
MSNFFVAFLGTMVVVVLGVVSRYLSRSAAATVAVGLALWLIYAGALGYLGVVGNPSLRPPGPALLLLPVFLFVALYLARTDGALRVATSIPLEWLMGLQAFRVIVELFLHQLWLNGLAPRMLTYEGANFDIAIGLSAPLVAWLYAKGTVREKAALAWNILGLAMLANVAVRALLTAPGPFQLLTSDRPNLAIGTFPFTYIPGFMAPLALVLHVLSIRSLRARLRRGRPVPSLGEQAAASEAK